MGKHDLGCTCGLHRPHSDEHRRKISEARKGKALSEEHQRTNAEHLRRLAAQKRGHGHSEEHRRKIADALKGRPMSDEHRRKMREVNKDPELKARRAAARIAGRKPPETYRAVHKRMVRDHGPAKNHSCADCGEPAKDWSYNGVTWENVAQDIFGRRGVFSTDLSDYQARCKGCHMRLDLSRESKYPWV